MCCSYPKVSHYDVVAALSEDYIANIQRVFEDIFKNDVLKYTVKEYKIELKPLFSAFELRPFAMTTLRSFLMFYLPLLEPATNIEEDDDDLLQDTPEERHVDLVVPLKKSVKQIIREVSCFLLFLPLTFLGYPAAEPVSRYCSSVSLYFSCLVKL